MQAAQVYYLPYPFTSRRERGDWLAVCKLQPKFADEAVSDGQGSGSSDDAFQIEEND